MRSDWLGSILLFNEISQLIERVQRYCTIFEPNRFLRYQNWIESILDEHL
jgi:hypothetical protein